jgi:hypothetical protein
VPERQLKECKLEEVSKIMERRVISSEVEIDFFNINSQLHDYIFLGSRGVYEVMSISEVQHQINSSL